jgi:hypothetical protein
MSHTQGKSSSQGGPGNGLGYNKKIKYEIPTNLEISLKRPISILHVRLLEVGKGRKMI